MPDWSCEDAAVSDGHVIIAGVDEAGRGPLAGPVVAAAVILERDQLSTVLQNTLDDSKKMRPAVRMDLYQELRRTTRFGVGQASVNEIDTQNILRASLLAMYRAVTKIMMDLDYHYPGYGWDRNFGYGTQEHRSAIARLGITTQHRRSFAPIRKMLWKC